MKKQYQYVIVGSGVAGSTLAMRLLENDRAASILMLEAGGDEWRRVWTGPGP